MTNCEDESRPSGDKAMNAENWRYEIQHGPDGEANYAWVYRGKNMVATMKTHDAKAICDRMNTPDPAVNVEAVKALNDDEIMEIIKEVAPWKDEPKLNDLLTYEKSVPLFPQATYDVPSYRAEKFVRAVERRVLSALTPQGEETPAPQAPAPSADVLVTESSWQWWAGSNDEWCTVGPEHSREAIIQAATNDSLGECDDDGRWKLVFHIVEARQDDLCLSDWIESDRLLERAEDSIADSDRTSSECDDGPWFMCSAEQEKDLEERVKAACDQWQAAHGLKFSCSTFSATRNKEVVIVDLPDDRAATEGSADV